jgi:hypothetical protein
LYYILDLQDHYIAVVQRHADDLLSGTPLNAQVVNLGVVVSVAIPRYAQGVARTQRWQRVSLDQLAGLGLVEVAPGLLWLERVQQRSGQVRSQRRVLDELLRLVWLALWRSQAQQARGGAVAKDSRNEARLPAGWVCRRDLGGGLVELPLGRRGQDHDLLRERTPRDRVRPGDPVQRSCEVTLRELVLGDRRQRLLGLDGVM